MRAGDSLDSGQIILRCRILLFYGHCAGQSATVTFGVVAIGVVDGAGGAGGANCGDIHVFLTPNELFKLDSHSKNVI